MKDFGNKVVVITGAGSGIGRALALEFQSLGARLALCDVNQKTLSETQQLVGEDTYGACFDIANRESVYEFASRVHEHFGQIDVVVNNAGVALGKGTTSEVTIEQYEWLLGINLWGMIYGSLAFLPLLRQRRESSLVNISSVFGLHGIPGQTAYCTSKFGIRGFTESLVLEERISKTGVAVACVHPGGIQTNIAKAAMKTAADKKALENIERAFITPPSKAAQRIINGIKRKKSRIIVGPDGMFLYLLTKLPHFVSLWFIKTRARELM